MRTLFVYFLITLLFSCKSNQSQDEDANQGLKDDFFDCLISKLDEMPSGDSTEFFKYLKQMENLALSENYLIEPTKIGYINFFKELYSDNIKAETLLKKLDKQIPNFSNYGLTGVLFRNKKCLLDLIQSNPDSKFLVDRINYFEKLEHSSFKDYDSFMSYIKLIDFKNEKDRLLLFCLLYNFMYLSTTG
ncbi:hypothetical protein [Winogradskyella sp.]|uniref:hypothetical protein n=1 Tax=Winogradskyella sp. TaxID=1883156 RepID=UPI003BAC88A5